MTSKNRYWEEVVPMMADIRMGLRELKPFPEDLYTKTIHVEALFQDIIGEHGK